MVSQLPRQVRKTRRRGQGLALHPLQGWPQPGLEGVPGHLAHTLPLSPQGGGRLLPTTSLTSSTLKDASGFLKLERTPMGSKNATGYATDPGTMHLLVAVVETPQVWHGVPGSRNLPSPQPQSLRRKVPPLGTRAVQMLYPYPFRTYHAGACCWGRGARVRGLCVIGPGTGGGAPWIGNNTPAIYT